MTKQERNMIRALRNLSALTTALIYAVETGKDELDLMESFNEIFPLQAEQRKGERR